MLSKENEALMALLACSLFGKKLEVDTETVDWSAVCDTASRHSVLALAYPAMKQSSSIKPEVMTRARNMAMSTAMYSAKMLKNQQEIIENFEKQDIASAVLKGFSIAVCYPHPELRASGDIDILVGTGGIDASEVVLTRLGYTCIKTAQRHDGFERADVSVELHRTVAPMNGNIKREFAGKFLENALHHIETKQLDGMSFPTLSGTYRIIAQLEHTARHLSISGIGLRQVCDWAMTVNNQRDCFDEDCLKVMDNCGLLRFAQVLTRLCEKYLGLPKCSWVPMDNDKQADALLEEIVSNGDFGEMSKRSIITALSDSDAIRDARKGEIFRNYWKFVKKYIQKNDPWANGWLGQIGFAIYLPLRWGIRVLMGKRKKVSVIQSVQTAQKRETLFKDLSLFN